MNFQTFCVMQGFHYTPPPAGSLFCLIGMDNFNGPLMKFFPNESSLKVFLLSKNDPSFEAFVYNLVTNQASTVANADGIQTNDGSQRSQ